jgi:hypothetical protein
MAGHPPLLHSYGMERAGRSRHPIAAHSPMCPSRDRKAVWGHDALGRGVIDLAKFPKTDIPVVNYRWRPVCHQCSLEIALKKLIRNNQGLQSASKVIVTSSNDVIDGSRVRVDSRR